MGQQPHFYATLIFGSNPVFELIILTILVLLSAHGLFRALKPASSSTKKATRKVGNEMQMKECAQCLVEGVLAASGVRLAAL